MRWIVEDPKQASENMQHGQRMLFRRAYETLKVRDYLVYLFYAWMYAFMTGDSEWVTLSLFDTLILLFTQFEF